MENPRQDTRQERASGPTRTVANIARVAARYGFGFVFKRRLVPQRGADLGRVGTRLRRSLEDLGPTYFEFGRFLAKRGDVIPPDVTPELRHASTGIRPVPFTEARALIERELHTDLPRLFVDFDETPTRVGALTQSHRATLPGERSALVVIRRPGIRRDLLAMRPVADLVRRRFGDRLPLDPSETVSDFIAHTSHRRDMYFAAQTARKIRDISGLGLRVPNLYRSHSTSSCLTLEAPENADRPSKDGMLDITERLVRLAMLEGVFFADLVPERFAVDGDGAVWLSDPTEVFSLEPERMRGLAEVFAAVQREDVDAIERAFVLAGGSLPQNTLALKRELREALGVLGGPLWSEHPLYRMRDTALEALRRGGAKLQPEVAVMLDSLVAAESLSRPGGVVIRPGEESPAAVAAVACAGDLVSRYRDPAYVAARVARRVGRPEMYAEYPRQIHSLLTELKDGEVEVRFRHGGLDQLISKVDILANRLVFAALIAALIIGSSMLGTFVDTGLQVLGVSIFGFVGFIVAAVLGVMLLVGIIRSGRI